MSDLNNHGTAWANSTIPCADAIADRDDLRGVWSGQTDSLASGRFRVANATASGTDFAVLGHDGGADAWQDSDLPPYFLHRLSRVWQAEVSGAASGDIVLDTSGLSDIGNGANLRLLVDTNGTFASGATVVYGTYGSPTFTVSGQALADGAYYTLALAQSGPFIPERVADIYPGSDWSSPYGLTFFNGLLYFSATDAAHGEELWQSGGSAASTALVKDIRAGSSGSSPRNLMAALGQLFMRANDGTTGDELWKSDGTTAGTALVKDIYDGTQSPVPLYLTAMGDRLYFVFENSTYGQELWKTDGTAANTVVVKDANPGSGDFYFSGLLAFNNVLYYGGDPWPSGSGEAELWRSDGTDAGTYRVKDINPSGNGGVSHLTALGNVFVFAADDGTNGKELWRSDGTEAGTVLVKDINPAAGTGSNPGELANIAGTVFFSASDGTNTGALWKTDGTEAGTVLVKDVNPSKGERIRYITEFKGQAFFQADDGTHGSELWKSDGTEAGTVLVKDINVGLSDADPTGLTPVGDWLFFVVNVGQYQLWRTDGTEAGTHLVMDDIKTGGSSARLMAVGRTLYLAADGNDGAGVELWRIPTVGPPGNALAFDGQDDYVQVSDADSLDLTNNYTLECWFKADQFDWLAGLISKYHTPNQNGYVLRFTGNLSFTGLGFDGMQTAEGLLTAGRWYHVAAVNSNGTRRLYLNGSTVPLSGTPITVQTNADPLCLGVDYRTNPRYFQGSLDEVRIWNVVRLEAEIRDAMHHELTGNEPGLVAYYRCNHELGTSLADMTEHHLDGILTNGPTWITSSFPCADAIAERSNLRGAWIDQTNSLASSILSVSNTVASGVDFRVFGHDDGALAQNTSDKPDRLRWRLDRAWQAEGAGGLTGDVTFDCSGIAGLITDSSRLRLLTDGDGVFTNTSSAAGSYVGGVFTVAGQALESGSYYTLGEERGNDPPSAQTLTLTRKPGVPVKIRLSNLATNWSDPDADATEFVSADATSTNSVPVSNDGTFLLYNAGTNQAQNVTDRFSYTIRDLPPDGITALTASGTVVIEVDAGTAVTLNIVSAELAPDGNARLTFAGIPGQTYLVQRTLSLTEPIVWTSLTNNVDGTVSFTPGVNGLWTHTDLNATNYSERYYRTAIP